MNIPRPRVSWFPWLLVTIVAFIALTRRGPRPDPADPPPPAKWRSVRQITLNDLTCRDAVAMLERQAGVTIEMPWDQLRFVGVYPDNRVTLTTEGRLDYVLRQLSKSPPHPSYSGGEGGWAGIMFK